MPRPTLTIESFGSMWMLDEHERVYIRMPKTEGPRRSPEGEDWGGPGAGGLQDLVWHPYDRWALHERSGRLVLCTPTEDEPTLIVTAPLSYEEFHRLADYDADAVDRLHAR